MDCAWQIWSLDPCYAHDPQAVSSCDCLIAVARPSRHPAGRSRRAAGGPFGGRLRGSRADGPRRIDRDRTHHRCQPIPPRMGRRPGAGALPPGRTGGRGVLRLCGACRHLEAAPVPTEGRPVDVAAGREPGRVRRAAAPPAETGVLRDPRLRPRRHRRAGSRLRARRLHRAGVRRPPRGIFFIGVNCSDPASTCFCTSMGTGPAVGDGADLILTELDPGDPQRHRFLVSPMSDRGSAIAAGLTPAAAGEVDLADAAQVTLTAISRMQRSMDTDGLPALLRAAVDHPRWDEVASRCLSCGNCTMACPTCFCADVSDEPNAATGTDERGASGRRASSSATPICMADHCESPRRPGIGSG